MRATRTSSFSAACSNNVRAVLPAFWLALFLLCFVLPAEAPASTPDWREQEDRGLHPIDVKLSNLESQIVQTENSVKIKALLLEQQRRAFTLTRTQQRSLRERHRAMMALHAPHHQKVKQALRRAIKQTVRSRHRSLRRLKDARRELKTLKQKLKRLRSEYDRVLAQWEGRLDGIEEIDRDDGSDEYF